MLSGRLPFLRTRFGILDSGQFPRSIAGFRGEEWRKVANKRGCVATLLQSRGRNNESSLISVVDVGKSAGRMSIRLGRAGVCVRGLQLLAARGPPTFETLARQLGQEPPIRSNLRRCRARS